MTAETEPGSTRTLRSPERGSTARRTPPARFAKLQPPRPHLRCVRRRTLLGDLEVANKRLVLVRAPAGTGKTTLLRQWAEVEERLFSRWAVK